MQLWLARIGVAVLGAALLALPALAAKPTPGQFSGATYISAYNRATQYLKFAVGGNGRRIYAFDIPACSGKDFKNVRGNKVVRPNVSKSGRINGSLAYDGPGPGNTVAHFAVRVTGRFVTAKRARGRVSVKVTLYRAPPGQPRKQVKEPCVNSGRWKARRCATMKACLPLFTPGVSPPSGSAVR
jgi:hypothetical protein